MPLALDLTNKLLEIIPTHQRALGNKVYYEEELEKYSNKKKGDDESEEIPYEVGVNTVRINVIHLFFTHISMDVTFWKLIDFLD